MEPVREVSISGFPRVHGCLIDLVAASGRYYGGWGITIDGLPIRATVNFSSNLKFEIDKNLDKNRLFSIIKPFIERHDLTRFRLKITSNFPAHSGLGSSTLATLTALECLNQAFSLQLDRESLTLQSKRGGTSGIGVNTFFSGKVILDAGHHQADIETIAPSSLSLPKTLPEIDEEILFPSNWKIHLLLPEGRKIFGQDELEIFQAACRLDTSEFIQCKKIVHTELKWAFQSQNIVELSNAVRSLHELGLKRIELQNQSMEVRELYRELSTMKSIVTGLSSMGPLIYVITINDDKSFEDWLLTQNRKIQSYYLGVFSGRNAGYEEC
jgi:beta-ribofuranosylaminobenzene 5'-phosphate synthase